MMTTAIKFPHSVPLFNYFNWHKNFGYDQVYYSDGSIALPPLRKPNNLRFDMKKKFPKLLITYRKMEPVLKSDGARVDDYALWKCFSDQDGYFSNN